VSAEGALAPKAITKSIMVNALILTRSVNDLQISFRYPSNTVETQHVQKSRGIMRNNKKS